RGACAGTGSEVRTAGGDRLGGRFPRIGAGGLYQRHQRARGRRPHGEPVSAALEVNNYIDGRLQPPAGDSWLDIHEPATGLVYGRVADSNGTDLQQAVAAATAAAPDWRRAGAEARARWLHALAELVEARAEQLAMAESAD